MSSSPNTSRTSVGTKPNMVVLHAVKSAYTVSDEARKQALLTSEEFIDDDMSENSKKKDLSNHTQKQISTYATGSNNITQQAQVDISENNGRNVPSGKFDSHNNPQQMLEASRIDDIEGDQNKAHKKQNRQIESVSQFHNDIHVIQSEVDECSLASSRRVENNESHVEPQCDGSANTVASKDTGISGKEEGPSLENTKEDSSVVSNLTNDENQNVNSALSKMPFNMFTSVAIHHMNKVKSSIASVSSIRQSDSETNVVPSYARVFLNQMGSASNFQPRNNLHPYHHPLPPNSQPQPPHHLYPPIMMQGHGPNSNGMVRMMPMPGSSSSNISLSSARSAKKHKQRVIKEFFSSQSPLPQSHENASVASRSALSHISQKSKRRFVSRKDLTPNDVHSRLFGNRPNKPENQNSGYFVVD